MRSVPGPKKFQERFPSLCHYAVRLEMLLVNVNILHDIVSVKDTQPGRITTRVEAAATFSVYRNIHSGKTIPLVVRGAREKLPEWNTSFGTLESIVITYSRRSTTPVDHSSITRRRVRSATQKVDLQSS